MHPWMRQYPWPRQRHTQTPSRPCQHSQPNRRHQAVSRTSLHQLHRRRQNQLEELCPNCEKARRFHQRQTQTLPRAFHALPLVDPLHLPPPQEVRRSAAWLHCRSAAQQPLISWRSDAALPQLVAAALRMLPRTVQLPRSRHCHHRPLPSTVLRWPLQCHLPGKLPAAKSTRHKKRLLCWRPSTCLCAIVSRITSAS